MEHWYYYVEGAVAAVAIIITAVVYGRGRLSKETIDLMQVNKRAQDDAIKRLEDNDKDKTQKIAHLSGQVDLLKDIPLKSISKSLEMLSTSHEALIRYTNAHDAAVDAAVNRAVTQVTSHIDAVMGNQQPSKTTVIVGNGKNGQAQNN